MANNEETIINKQIDVETIIELANYLEDQKEEYDRLMELDENKNKGLSYDEQVYQYRKMGEPKVEYEITFKDNKDIQQSDYNWFIGNLTDIAKVKKINMYFSVSYTDNSRDKDNAIHRRMSENITFYEDRVYLRVDGTELEDEVYKRHSYIRGVLERGEDRYNKTVKNRMVRIQSFCLSIGFVLSYIIYFILNGMKADLPEILVQMIENKYVIIIGQWFVAAIVGNIFGYAIMMGLYRNILPKTKYSHYSSSSHKSVYVDDVDNYVGECEVHIGQYANCGKNRALIEKIYKVTRIIVLVQLAISIILFFILK